MFGFIGTSASQSELSRNHGLVSGGPNLLVWWNETQARRLPAPELIGAQLSQTLATWGPLMRFRLRLSLVLLWCAMAVVGTPPAQAAPNFIVIFVDDQGYGDLGCDGSKTIDTPNIGRLADEGRQFTSFMVDAQKDQCL